MYLMSARPLIQAIISRLFLDASSIIPCELLLKNQWKKWTRPLQLRGGVGAPKDVGAPGYEEYDPWELLYPPEVNKTQLFTIKIPGTHPDIKAAIPDLQHEHDVCFAAGDHRWDDHVVLPLRADFCQTIRFRGIQGVRLLGRWILPACELVDCCPGGSFRKVVCAYATSYYLPTDFKPNAVFTIMGEPWMFSECEIRAAEADAIIAFHLADVLLLHCHVGGMGKPWILNGTMGAVNGLHCGGKSVLTVTCCNFEFCGTWGGCAVRCVEEAVCSLQNCTLKASFVGFALDDGASAKVLSCKFRDNQFGNLAALPNATFSTLELSKCTIHEGKEYLQGCVWVKDARPGNFIESENEIVKGYSLAESNDDWFHDKEDIPEEQWETHPDLIRIDRIPDYLRGNLEREDET